MDTDPWPALPARVVMVASWSERDGIGRYAEQMIAAHSDGREFFRVGIPEAPGDLGRELHRGGRAVWLLRDARRRDAVVVQYHPHYYIRGGTLARIASYASWGLLALARDVSVVAHEADPPGAGLEERVRRWFWRRARRIVWHSQRQRDEHAARYGARAGQDLVVLRHGDFFTTNLTDTHAQARSALGLGADRVVLLLIGFFSAVDPDKGYDRAIAAVRASGEPVVELHIVGSPIRPGAVEDRLVEELRAAAEQTEAIHLHEGFVGDDAFDRWLRAADAVIVPYRTASSSGVVARAQLVGTTVMVSDAGGLAEQAREGDVVFTNEAELVAAIRRLAQRANSSR